MANPDGATPAPTGEERIAGFEQRMLEHNLKMKVKTYYYDQKMLVLEAACSGKTAKECAAYANENKQRIFWMDVEVASAARWIRELNKGNYPPADEVIAPHEAHVQMAAEHRRKKAAFFKKWNETAPLRDPAAKKAKAKAEKEEKKAAEKAAKAASKTTSKKATAKKSAEPATAVGKKSATKKKGVALEPEDEDAAASE